MLKMTKTNIKLVQLLNNHRPLKTQISQLCNHCGLVSPFPCQCISSTPGWSLQLKKNRPGIIEEHKKNHTLII